MKADSKESAFLFNLLNIKRMKKIFSLIVLMALVPSINALAETSAETTDSTTVEKPKRKCSIEAGVGFDVVSSYLWRGSQLDKAAIQPDAYISWKGLTFDVWGSAGFADGLAFPEIDLSLSYTIKGFSIGVTDYYCPAAAEDLYFTGGPHTIEVGVGYDLLGYVAFNWYTNVYNDEHYSSYFEISAPFSIGAIDFSAAVGCSPYHSDFYGTKSFNVINCCLTAGHEFELKSCSFPISATLMANPAAKAVFFAVSAGIAF